MNNKKDFININDFIKDRNQTNINEVLENIRKNIDKSDKPKRVLESQFNDSSAHEPYIIYGKIYSNVKVKSSFMDENEDIYITVIVNDHDDNFVDDSILTDSYKVFNLPLKDYGRYQNNSFNIDNYFNYWMPLKEFMRTDNRTTFKVKADKLPKPKKEEPKKEEPKKVEPSRDIKEIKRKIALEMAKNGKIYCHNGSTISIFDNLSDFLTWYINNAIKSEKKDDPFDFLNDNYIWSEWR